MSSSKKVVAGEGGRPKRRRRQSPPPVSDAMSSSEKEDVDRDAALSPFDPAATPAAARQVADATRAAVPKFATQQGEVNQVIRAELRAQEAGGDAAKQKQRQPTKQQNVGGQDATEHALVMQQRREQAVAQHGGSGRGFPDGPPRQTTAQASASDAAAAAAQAAGEQMLMRQNRNRVAHQGTGPAVAGDGRGHAQRSRQIAGAERSVDPVALEQDLMMRQQIAAGKKKVMPEHLSESQQLNAAAEAAMQRDMEMQVSRQADAQEQYYNAVMAQARQRAAAENIAVDKDVAMIMKAAADAGLTLDQYCDYMMQTMISQGASGGQQQDHRGQAVAHAGALTMEQHRRSYMTQMTTTMQQDVGGGQQQHHRGMTQMMTMQQNVGGGRQQQHHRGQVEQFAGTGMTRDKNMTMAQQILAKHQKLEEEMKRKIAHAQQVSAVAEAARQKVLVAMQQQQQAAAYANAMQGSGSGATTIMPFQPTGTANTDAFRVQQQLQLQPQLQSQHQTVNVQFQEESPSLPPLPPWLANVQPHQEHQFLLLPDGSDDAEILLLADGSDDAEAFDFEQELLLLPQTVTAHGQEEPSLPSWPGLAPPQQQTFLPGGLSGSANSQAFLAQQQPQQQRVNELGSQEEQYDLPPLPPSLADWPRQQQNDGGDGGLSDLYWNQFRKLSPGGRQ